MRCWSVTKAFASFADIMNQAQVVYGDNINGQSQQNHNV